MFKPFLMTALFLNFAAMDTSSAGKLASSKVCDSTVKCILDKYEGIFRTLHYSHRNHGFKSLKLHLLLAKECKVSSELIAGILKLMDREFVYEPNRDSLLPAMNEIMKSGKVKPQSLYTSDERIEGVDFKVQIYAEKIPAKVNSITGVSDLPRESSALKEFESITPPGTLGWWLDGDGIHFPSSLRMTASEGQNTTGFVILTKPIDAHTLSEECAD